MAFGPLEMMPDDFNNLQPHEFMQQWNGYIWRKENKENILAFFTCHLLNMEGKSLKNAIKPSDILKPLRQEKNKKTKSEDEKHLIKAFNLEEVNNNGNSSRVIGEDWR